MAYTVTDFDRLRRDVGADNVTLTNAAALAIFTEAAELYTGAGSLRAGARVIALTGMISGAAKYTDYAQDTTQEKQSQVFDHLLALLKFWQTALDKALLDEEETTNAASAQSIRIPVIASW